MREIRMQLRFLRQQIKEVLDEHYSLLSSRFGCPLSYRPQAAGEEDDVLYGGSEDDGDAPVWGRMSDSEEGESVR